MSSSSENDPWPMVFEKGTDSAGDAYQKVAMLLLEGNEPGLLLKSLHAQHTATVTELESKNAALMSANDDLGEAIARLEAQVAMLEARYRRKGLHVIALQHVFTHLLPPTDMFDPSIFRGPNSYWCSTIRTLKSVTLVCKTWHAAALPLLYRSVVIRRAGQLIAFAETVRSSPETFAGLVKGLIICCPVPKHLFAAVRASLVAIIAQCTQLQTISFRTLFPLQEILDHSEGPDPHTSIALLPPTLVSLGLCDDESTRFMYKPLDLVFKNFLPSFQQLLSLSIHVESITADVRGSQLCFPRLASLTFWADIESTTLPLQWDIPVLRVLRFRPAWLRRYHHVYQFCKKYGAGLVELDFGRHGCAAPVQYLGEPFSPACLGEQIQCAGCCPMLEHLVLKVNDPERNEVVRSLKASELFGRTIDVVDFVCADYFWGPVGRGREAPVYHEGAAWKRTRYWDWRLLTDAPNLPYLILEQDPSNSRSCMCEYYGFPFLQKGSMFYIPPTSRLRLPSGYLRALRSRRRSGSETESLESSDDSIEISGEDEDSEESSREASSVYSSDDDDDELEPGELEDEKDEVAQLREEDVLEGFSLSATL